MHRTITDVSLVSSQMIEPVFGEAFTGQSIVMIELEIPIMNKTSIERMQMEINLNNAITEVVVCYTPS